MGQKRTSQGDQSGDTENPERDSGTEGASGFQSELGEQDLDTGDGLASTTEDLDVTDSYRESMENMGFDNADDESAAKFMEATADLTAAGEKGLTEAQIENMGISGEPYGDLASDVVSETTLAGNIAQGGDESVQLKDDMTMGQARVAAAHAMVAANGIDTRQHAAGEQARRNFEQGGTGAALPENEDERSNRELSVENYGKSTSWMQNAADASNNLYNHYVDTAEQNEDGEWEADYEFDAARDDSMRAVSNGREAFVLMSSSVTKEESTLGTNSLVHHGDELKSTVEAIGEENVSRENKESIQYMHEVASSLDDVESPWSGDGPYADMEYDREQARKRIASNRFQGAGVDDRFI